MNRFIRHAWFLSIILVPASARADEEPSISFSRDVQPILSDKCFLCHGPDAKRKDLVRLDSFAGATRDLGGYKAIDPTNPGKSEILARINSPRKPMPPRKAEKKLTPKEREILNRWVQQGGKYETHWAFVPPQKHKPALKGIAPDNIIDAFILAQLQTKKIGFAPEADRATLARRVALTLTGLPPEPAQLKTFLKDTRADAYERFVDEMLASSRFGEHQARYWLDAVRYGDTHGLHLDNRRGIYPYRDWVVRAFNDNLPLDDFLTWQLAGDLLPNPTLDQLIATGFVRMNPTTSEGGVIPAEFQAKNNFDRTETLGTVLLGMSLTCARCHNHKYDPIPQQEYYQLLAFFNSTAERSLDGNSYTYAPIIKVPQDDLAWRQWKALKAAREKFVRKVELPHSLKTWTVEERLKALAYPTESFMDPEIPREAHKLFQRIEQVEGAFTTTLVAKDLPQPRPTHVLKRGEYNQPTGDPLIPGVLSVMGAFPKDAPRNRLGLARWLTAREHPLVARVLINRIWQRTFGESLVRTPEDFGLQGQQPTHPELLDWLAVELHDSKWNLKQTLRLMVTSRTFRQSSKFRKDVQDPENRLFARGPRYRLDAEVLRDIALWSSELLDPRLGGEGVKPYQPSGLWSALAHPASNTKQYVRDKGQKLYRRSLYVYWKRTSPHPMMMLFDAPSRESSCVKRSRTNTALQSLGLFNETQRVEAGRTFAQRLLLARDDDTERLDFMFQLLACRKPSDRERFACETLLKLMRARYQDAEKDALALLSTGDAPRDEKLNVVEHAAWTQVVSTVLASDIAILQY